MQLQRAIRLPQATALVVGTIIGASIFVQPSEITGRVPSVSGALLVWLVAGLLTLAGALVCAELSSSLPRTGGVYVYLSEAYSPAVGFLWGWAMFWTMHTGIIAAISVVCARYLGYFVPLGDAATKGVAVGVVAVLSWVNAHGVRLGSQVQAAFTVGKVVAIVVMVLAGFLLAPGAPGGATSVAATAVVDLDWGLTDFVLAVAAGLFAFGGWHMVTYNAEETVDPTRTLPRALVVGVLVVTACYMALNAVYFRILPVEVVASSSRVAAEGADAVLGSGGAALMAALVVFSTLGALTGIILAGPRVYYAMARDGLLFRWLGVLHPRHGTPHRAILAQAVWAAFLIATGTYRALFTRVVYTEWLFFGAMALGAVLLRRRADLLRAYEMPLFPALPLLFALASFAVVVNQVVAEPLDSAVGLAFVLVGLPVYALWARRTPAPRGRPAERSEP